MSRAVMVAALRRLLVLTVGVTAATVGISALAGLALGSSLNRAISLGLYVFGCFLLVSGFFVGNRGPVRLKNDSGHPLFGSRVVRWASPEEREETLNLSAVFVVLGFTLILLGVVADDRFKLF